MKFKVGDLVNCDNYEMDGCCHDCEGTSHYLKWDVFTITEIRGDYAYHDDCQLGYFLPHLLLVTPLGKLL